MKKFILSCFVFLAGVIGAIGWIIASAAEVSGGLTQVLYSVTGGDRVFVIVFSAIALLGLISAVKEVRKEE